MSREIDRRTFMKRMSLGGGSLVLGVWLAACDDEGESPVTTGRGEPTTTVPTSSTMSSTTTVVAVDPTATFAPHLLLSIGGDETVTVTIPKVEMGQGVRTALAMIVAEELDAEWSAVRVETAPGDRVYGDQVTGGSLSISSRFDSMRRVGGIARRMLIEAAAGLWGIDPDDCHTVAGSVIETDGDRQVTYGALVGLASAIEVPATGRVEYKGPADYRIVGTPVGSVDALPIVTGAATYGSDVRLPGMLHAVVARSPIFEGRVVAYDDRAARDVPGVVDVIQISTGVAVVAVDTWSALRGRDALEVDWDPRGNATLDGASVVQALRDRLEPVAVEGGEITADYTLPFMAHASMETLTCVAAVSDDSCEMWAATQHPQLARAVAAAAASLPTEKVTLHVPLMGGGFGRRLDQDFVRETAEIATAVRRPVKLFWSRTDDLRNDRYHPAGVCRLIGSPDGPENVRIQMELARNGSVPTGDWRSVTNAPEAFALQCFIDELADAAGRDPYEYRRSMLAGAALAALDLAADSAGWGDPLPQGWGRGIAIHSTWGVSPTAVVAEVEVVDGAIRIDRLVSAIDCGLVVNPDSVAAQLEGAAVFAVSAALLGGVTIVDGGVGASNFHDAPISTAGSIRSIETHVVPSTARPTGVGEAGVPPVAPAIANAVFAATGRRLRELPLRL